MKRYRVEWDSYVEDELAEIWIVASDRDAVTAAQAAGDKLLSSDPYGAGTHVSEGLYRIRIPPLSMIYSIHEPQGIVDVESVRAISH